MFYRLLDAALFGLGVCGILDLIAVLIIEFIASRMENQLGWGHDLPSAELYAAIREYKDRNRKKWQNIAIAAGALAALYNLLTGKAF